MYVLTWARSLYGYHEYTEKLLKIPINSSQLNKVQLFQLQKRVAKWRQSFVKIVFKELIFFFVKNLKFLYISDITIWFKFRQHVVQICVK